MRRDVKRVLVTGSSGVLGSELISILKAELDVIPADLEQFDLRDAQATASFTANAAPDVVVNCAAWTDVDGAESNEAGARAVNSDGAENVARAAVEAGADVVQVSTDYVFDGTGERPYAEDDEPNPLGVYGRTKLEGERRVLAAAPDCLIVRTAWLYGHAGTNFVEKILALVESGRPLKVVEDQVGAPTSAKDLAGAIRDLIAVGATGVVNATNAGSCSWFEFAREILDRSGHAAVSIEPVASDRFPRPAPRPSYSVLSLARLVSLTGREPRHWRDALRDYLAER
jgi:dTDP-4-dehydrorhamnose reductase